MQVARICAVIYLGIGAVMFSLQTRLIFPGASTQGQAFAEVRPRRGTELVHLKTSNGDRVVALYGAALLPDGRPDPLAASRPTMIFFYGNAMCLNYSDSQLEEFRRLGLNVLIPEYVGYGMSSGSPSERGCRATAFAAYDYLIEERNVPPEQIIAARLVPGRSRRDRSCLRAARRRLDRILVLHERRRDGQARTAIPSCVDFAPPSIRQHSQDREDHMPNSDRSRALGQTHPVRDGRRAGKEGRRACHHALDRSAPNTTTSSTWAARQIDQAIVKFVAGLPRSSP